MDQYHKCVTCASVIGVEQKADGCTVGVYCAMKYECDANDEIYMLGIKNNLNIRMCICVLLL